MSVWVRVGSERVATYSTPGRTSYRWCRSQRDERCFLVEKTDQPIEPPHTQHDHSLTIASNLVPTIWKSNYRIHNNDRIVQVSIRIRQRHLSKMLHHLSHQDAFRCTVELVGQKNPRNRKDIVSGVGAFFVLREVMQRPTVRSSMLNRDGRL